MSKNHYKMNKFHTYGVINLQMMQVAFKGRQYHLFLDDEFAHFSLLSNDDIK